PEGGFEALVRGVVGRVEARATERDALGLLLRRFHEILETPERARLGDDQRVGRVVKPVHRRDVVGLVLHRALHRLQHVMRQVDAGDVQPVAGQLVQLHPQQAAAGPRLVLDDGLDRRAFLLQHQLLVARRQIGLARSEERRVGKECRSRGWPEQYKKKTRDKASAQWASRESGYATMPLTN